MKTFITLILFIFSAIVFGQNKECSKYKNGKFKIVTHNVITSIIERTETKQIESSGDGKTIFELKVKWLNECTYSLEFVKFLENPNNIEFPKGLVLTVEIIETKNNSYIQKSSSNLFDMVLESEMIKID